MKKKRSRDVQVQEKAGSIFTLFLVNTEFLASVCSFLTVLIKIQVVVVRINLFVFITIMVLMPKCDYMEKQTVILHIMAVELSHNMDANFQNSKVDLGAATKYSFQLPSVAFIIQPKSTVWNTNKQCSL